MLSFPNSLYAVAFASAFVLSWGSLPFWRGIARRNGWVDDPGHRKIHTEPIALAGGFSVLTGLLLPLLVGAVAIVLHWVPSDTLLQASYGLRQRAGQLLAIMIGAVAMLGLGWIDDKHELSPKMKFLGQLLIATLVASAGVRITLFVPYPAVSYALTILWILTLTNAFNFMDNMNGLCAGVGAVAAASFASAAAGRGQYLVTVIALMTCGALMGFVPHNYPKATAFLGDAGSHLTGYLLSVMAILPHFHSTSHPDTFAVLQPLFILAVPLLDLVSVVFIRWRLGKPFYIGDNNHFSHRLVRAGHSKSRAVLLLWFAAAGIAAIGMAL